MEQSGAEHRHGENELLVFHVIKRKKCLFQIKLLYLLIPKNGLY